jgi:hypothetical protein
VLCAGEPAYGSGGFKWDGTSTGWLRQYGSEPYAKPSMVTFDDRVDVMNSLGCHTIKAEIHPHDPTTNNGTVQRAQIIFDHGPSAIGAIRGQTWYYGWAFATNPAYTAQHSTTWPQFNVIMSWHGTRGSPYFSGTGTIISTLNERNDGSTFPYADKKYHLMFDSVGTDCTGKHSQWHIHDPRPFQPGHRYVIQEEIRWGDSHDGGMAVWVDGRQILHWTTGLSNMACGYGVYPVFENYRPADALIGNLLSGTNDAYYGGLIKGTTLSDVAIPRGHELRSVRVHRRRTLHRRRRRLAARPT